MIGLEVIEETIKYTLYTAYVMGERPLSLLLIAAVESGKTEVEGQFLPNKGVLCVTDFTAYGLVKKYLARLLAGDIKYLLIPDLAVPLSKSKDTVNSTIAFLSALMEEGVKEIATYNFPDGLQLPHPVRAGVIAAMATEDFNRRRPEWSQAGFLSRFLPLTYAYDRAMVESIFTAIVTGTKLTNDIRLDFPEEAQEVALPMSIGEDFKPLAKSMANSLRIYGFRPLRHLIRLAKGRALSCGRTVVNAEDRDRILELSRFFNLEHNELK